jgi:hypothetical protein
VKGVPSHVVEDPSYLYMIYKKLKVCLEPLFMTI